MILQNLAIIFIAVFCSYSEYMYLSQIENIGNKHLIISFSVLNLIKYLLYWYFGIYFPYFVIFLIVTLILSRKLLHSLMITVLLFVISYARYPILRLIMQDRFDDIMFEKNGLTANLYIFVLSALAIFAVCQIMRKEKLLLFIPILSVIGVSGVFYAECINIDSILTEISVFVFLTINLISFTVYDSYAKMSENLRELSLVEQKKKLDYEHYKLMQDNYNNSRKLMHDIKHHFTVIQGMTNTDDIHEYITALSQQPIFESRKKFTGNRIVDIIINQKFEECQKKNIVFNFEHNHTDFSFMEETDICCIFSNLLDNAVEASNRSIEKNIDCKCYTNRTNQLYFIEISNSCDNKPITEENKLVTYKKDQKTHGIGMVSVKDIVEKYHGDLHFEYLEENHIFRTVAMLKRR